MLLGVIICVGFLVVFFFIEGERNEADGESAGRCYPFSD